MLALPGPGPSGSQEWVMPLNLKIRVWAVRGLAAVGLSVMAIRSRKSGRK